MALSRRDVILAGTVAFITWGLAVKELPFLRFIGYAFTLGFITALLAITALILLSSKLVNSQDTYNTPPRLQCVKFLEPETWQTETASWKASAVYRKKALYPSSFVISDKLDNILELVQRDYITSWYRGISQSPRFRKHIDTAIRMAIYSIVGRLEALDLAEIGVSRLVPIITNHLKDFGEAERLVRGKNLNRNVTESEELDVAIASKYRDGKLHAAASLSFSDLKLAQQDHLRKIVVRLLPQILPGELIRSRAVSVLIKEIVACSVLFPIMQMLSDPDTWNQLMEGYVSIFVSATKFLLTIICKARAALQDRKTVRKLRAALDEHASPNPKSSEPRVSFPRLSAGDSERQFERFIRAIRQANNLSDARRMRSEVSSQLKRESLVEGQDPIYLRRLEIGKRVLDQRVAKLSSTGRQSSKSSIPPEFRNGSESGHQANVSLVEIMHNAAGLSYFMEYMDRQQLMSLVQFWIVVDGFRNPLESDFVDQEDSQGLPEWTNSERMDVAQINEAYLSKPELKVPEQSRAAVRAFLKTGRHATPLQYRKARSAILKSQTAVLEELTNNYFPGFKKSDLYYKYLTTDETAILSTLPVKPITELPSQDDRPRLISRKTTARMLPRSSSRVSFLPRSAYSSTDIRSMKPSEQSGQQRRSLDNNTSAPLFDDEYDTDPLAHSTASLGNGSRNGDSEDHAQTQVVEAMEAALNSIITDPQDQEDEIKDSIFSYREPSLSNSYQEQDSPKSSMELSRSELRSEMSSSDKEKHKPSLASLGLVNTSSRIGVFSDNDLFEDEEKFAEDEHADPVQPEKETEPEDEIHEAAPGDLGLVEAIAALTSDIERLTSQEAVVDALTKKAELTNNAAELRILSKSKASLRREIRRKELQRQQYIVQESDNSLYGRSSVRIKKIMVGKEDDGKEFALYMIEVQRKAGEQMSAASWVIARRYSEFHELHARLRACYPSVRGLEFPRRRMVMKLQKDFLHKRRDALQNYLQALLRLPEVCRSRDLRAFLSQQAIIASDDRDRNQGTQDIITRIYNSVTDGMDDFLGNIPVLDQLSIAGQNLISAATNHLSTLPSTLPEDPIGTAEAEAELNAFENRELEPFVKPICDIFLEIFELNRGNNWLRGRAVVVVLHQLLGGTIERKVRDNAKDLAKEDSILKYLDMVKDTMWPNNGETPRETKVRTPSDKVKSRREAGFMLATLVPDMAGNVVGRANAQAASRKIFATMNNARLNTHLAYTLLDEIVKVLFD
ncbi:MAG: Intermediate filament protein [Cirrosporium novae-zelandiae]|nr:MAG: Intermediate filament protein [Cirrosporium novae-zelandiae]